MSPSILQLLKDISAERDVKNRANEIQEAKRLGLVQKGMAYFRPWILTSQGCCIVNRYLIQTSKGAIA